MQHKVSIGAAVLFLASFGLLYRDVLVKLVHDWATDGNYSHGFLIVPLAAYLVWERRARIGTAAPRPSTFGPLLILGGAGLLLTGTLGADLFLMRISMLVVLTGAVLFILGREHLRIVAFPLAFLLLMIPLPAIVFNQIALPLQLVASQFGELILSTLAIPVLREGNVLVLANTTLQVAEACSGIRSLISLLTLSILYGYFIDPRATVRLTLAAVTIPVAIVANGLRVAGTGVAAHYYGAEAAEGFFHTFSGWLVFVVALGFLFVIHRLVRSVTPVGEVSSFQIAAG